MSSSPYLAEAFFQANLIDGFGFFDTRGALVRKFQAEFGRLSELREPNELPSFQFSQPTDPEHPIVEIRVGMRTVWMHFRSGNTTSVIRHEAHRVTEAACAIVGATRFARQGLRLQYIFAATNEQQASENVQRIGLANADSWGRLGRIGAMRLELAIAGDPFQANIVLSPVKVMQTHVVQTAPSETTTIPSIDEPSIGMMLDADIFDDRRSDSRDPNPFLRRASEHMEEQVIPLVTGLLERS